MQVKTCTCRSRMRAIRCRSGIKLQRRSSALNTSSSPSPIPLSRWNQSSSDATFRLGAAESHYAVAGGLLGAVCEERSTDRREKDKKIAMQVVVLWSFGVCAVDLAIGNGAERCRRIAYAIHSSLLCSQ